MVLRRDKWPKLHGGGAGHDAGPVSGVQDDQGISDDPDKPKQLIMSDLFNPGAVIGAQGGGVQDEQHVGGLGVVHDRVVAHMDDTCGQGGYQRGWEGNTRGGEVHHHHPGERNEGQRDGLHHARVVGGQEGDGEVLTQKLDVRKKTPRERLNPGSRRKATPKRKFKEI